MEEGLATRLNVNLGDSVTFTGDTRDFTAKVTSLRKVDWESLRPNFFFIFPPGALDGQPQSWLTSFRWENGNGMLTQLNREFPTVSLLDIGAILKQVGQVLEQVSRALEVMVVLVTICGILLLLAQVQVGMRQRHQELVVYRTLGPVNGCCAPRCGANLPCSGWWRAGGGHRGGNGAGGTPEQSLRLPVGARLAAVAHAARLRRRAAVPVRRLARIPAVER